MSWTHPNPESCRDDPQEWIGGEVSPARDDAGTEIQAGHMSSRTVLDSGQTATSCGWALNRDSLESCRD